MTEPGKGETGGGGWLASRRAAPKSPNEALKPTAAPPPPPKTKNRRRRPFIALLSGVFTLGVVAAAVIGTAVLILGRHSREAGPLPLDKVVIIPKESGLGEIAELLQREGVIDQPWAFRFAALSGGSWTRLKAGEYLFKAHVSAREALDLIEQGKAVLHSVTIPEGLTSEQIMSRLVDNDILTGDVPQAPREGTILPDTYKFHRGTTRQELLNRMGQEQRRILADVWSKRAPDLPIKTPQELVILASIVEKETGKADERPRVAGVFINRIRKKMKLQSDPTIVYGLVGGKGTLGRSITRAEINQATPYNTYVIEGLPPGPIANPGRAALQAVANPSRTKDLFFVADGTGGHAFAETLEQHNRNVVRWRQVEASRKESTPSPDSNVDRAEPPPAPDSRSEVAPANRALGFAPEDVTIGDVETYPAPVGRTRVGAAKPRAFDASEGTPRDPLLNKSFDLNSPKVVPDMRR